jgi:SAM-dependent methyltransferase
MKKSVGSIGTAREDRIVGTVIDYKERQKMTWGGAAAGWNRRFDWYSKAFRPLMAWCCDAARIVPGMRVLDVACGTGQPAFEAAGRVGATGTVVAIDLSVEMLRHAQRRAYAGGLGQLAFVEMDAEQITFPDRAFDAVTCACGLMFFPDGLRALREMRRVLSPGGRLAVAVWDDPSKSPFFTIAGRAVAEFFPPAAPDPNAPGGFRFAAPDALESLLREAGFSDVDVESRRMPLDFENTGDYWQTFIDLAAGAAEKVATLPETDRTRLRGLVEEAASRFMDEGRLRLHATPLCASARA